MKETMGCLMRFHRRDGEREREWGVMRLAVVNVKSGGGRTRRGIGLEDEDGSAEKAGQDVLRKKAGREGLGVSAGPKSGRGR